MNRVLFKMATSVAILGMTQMAIAQVPDNIKLWVLDDKAVSRSDFGKFSKWYQEPDKNTQTFHFYKGDVSTSGRIHARMEVHSGLEFKPGTKWYRFEATYKINTEVTDQMSIAQLFDYSEVHPQLMVHLWDNHRVTFQPRGEGRTTLGEGYKNKPFSIKIRSNGTDIEFYFNGIKKHAGKIANPAATARNGFRWGIYFGTEVPSEIFSTVTNVYRGEDIASNVIQPIINFDKDRFSIKTSKEGAILFDYSVSHDSRVSMTLCNLQGRPIVNSFTGIVNAGSSRITWKLPKQDLSSGMYLLRAKMNDKAITQQVGL